MGTRILRSKHVDIFFFFLNLMLLKSLQSWLLFPKLIKFFSTESDPKKSKGKKKRQTTKHWIGINCRSKAFYLKVSLFFKQDLHCCKKDNMYWFYGNCLKAIHSLTYNFLHLFTNKYTYIHLNSFSHELKI